MTDAKTDYPPLLDAGIHPFSIDQLRQLTVTGFPESKRRPGLFGALTVYLDMLESSGFAGTIWVDGSFMCQKLEPDDIDLVIVYESEAIDALSESAKPVVNNLFNTSFVKARFNLHVFQVRTDDKAGVDFWFRKFGTQRDDRTPKGLAALRVNL
jgi:hypothetical protein